VGCVGCVWRAKGRVVGTVRLALTNAKDVVDVVVDHI